MWKKATMAAGILLAAQPVQALKVAGMEVTGGKHADSPWTFIRDDETYTVTCSNVKPAKPGVTGVRLAVTYANKTDISRNFSFNVTDTTTIRGVEISSSPYCGPKGLNLFLVGDLKKKVLQMKNYRPEAQPQTSAASTLTPQT